MDNLRGEYDSVGGQIRYTDSFSSPQFIVYRTLHVGRTFQQKIFSHAS